MAASRLPGLSLLRASRRRMVGPDGRRGMMRTLFGRTATGERRGKSQSRVLRDTGSMCEMQVERVKLEFMEDYLKASGEHLLRVSESSELPAELLGAWTTTIGPAQDEITHIWHYKSYSDFSTLTDKLREDKPWQEYSQMRGRSLHSRGNQIILPFAFWEISDPTSFPKKGLYELRSYVLKPGTLIEWGQAWKEGIQYRKEESVGGWFSQIGLMHQVHHMWAYKDLQDRNETRQAAWEFPGWDECVVRTVPLIRHMDVRILTPTAYSPLT